ncbi:MAG: AAA family ATPase [Roseateles sp.]|uniref:AAA family ATPase n=1 Tax=Roseateles sp. TaxID=1971397 RepID=UPI0040356E4A
MPRINRVVSRLKRPASPANHAAQLRNLVAAHTGTVILRVPSGTDSTPVAEALGRTMDRSVVKVDLAQVASRFIGETEKNLDRLFAAAAASGAVLFFDEADALFGKRSDIKDSHDRYANVELGYLLQKIEAYSGIVVLASNALQGVDPALSKRLRHALELAWPPTDE